MVEIILTLEDVLDVVMEKFEAEEAIVYDRDGNIADDDLLKVHLTRYVGRYQ